MPKAKKTKSGSWKVRVLDHEEIVYDENGAPVKRPDGHFKKKQFFRAFTSDDPSPAGKRKAERMAAEYLANADHSEPIEKMTVHQAIKKYIALKEEVLSPTTVRGYETLLRNSYKQIDDILIDRIKNTELQSWINILSIDHSPKTVSNAWGLFASTAGLFIPGRIFKVTLPTRVEPDLYTPSDDDIKKLLDFIKDTELEKAVLLSAFGTLRRGEICALTADDIFGNMVTVNKSMVRSKNGLITKTPKTPKSCRKVILPDFVIEKFDGCSGRLVNMAPNDITKKFDRAVANAGLPHFRFHDLRHYSASIMHAIGIPDQYIMDRGGWKSDQVMKKVYRNVISAEKQKFTDQINGHFDSIISHDSEVKS